MWRLQVILIVAVLLSAGCSQSGKVTSKASPAAPVLTSVPVTLTLKQRSNQIIPGSDGVRITIDDITRGQVMVSVAGKDGASLLNNTSLEPGKSTTFKFGTETYTLTLKELKDSLVGEDFATFVISGAAAARLSEKEKIERLIVHVEQLKGAVFVRNGTEHSAKEAAGHLRTKWEAAGDRVTTAREFIDHLASRSSISSETYTIKLADGTTRPAGEYLHQRLSELER